MTDRREDYIGTLPAQLVGVGITLSLCEIGDAAEMTLALNRNREHLVPWMPWALSLPQEEAATRAYLETTLAERARGETFAYAIRENRMGALIGSIGLHRRVGPGGLEIGYWLDKKHTGRGLMTEAASIVTAAGFEHFGATRLEIHVHPGNGPSLRIAERLGYEREGLLRARFPWPDGPWRDQVVLSMLAPEFRGSDAGQVTYRALDADGEVLSPRMLQPVERF